MPHCACSNAAGRAAGSGGTAPDRHDFLITMNRTERIGKRILRFLLPAAAVLALAACAPLHAQTGEDLIGTPGGTGDRTILEGIAALVGDKVILISDVVQRAALIKGSSPSLGLSEQQLYREVLDELIATNLLLMRAEEDSIVVTDDIINAQLDERINQLVQQVGGSSAVLEQYYGKSIAEIRAEARPIIRDQLMVEFLRRRRFDDLKVTERDMEEFYRQYRDSLPQVPEQVEIARILILEKPSTEARDRTVALARAIIDSLKNGGDFADFARRYSVDPSSAAHGGEVGWVKNGRFVPEYENAARALNINQMSEPVESKFGIHIIQLLDKKDDELRSRHILLPLKAEEAQKRAIVDTLNSIRSRALAGESFGALAAKYSEDEESRYNNGIVTRYPTDELPASYQWIMDSLKVGGISEPRPTRPSPTESGYHIIKLNRIIPPHTVDMKEDRDQVEQLATVWKQNQKLQEWLDELRKEIYWEVKYDFN